MDINNKLVLVTNGDSWTFGCEIVNPELIKQSPNKVLTEIDYHKENDSYRTERIWPTHLAKLLNARVANISKPGDDNTSILYRTVDYVSELLKTGYDPANILVVIGWTSPERRDFYYKTQDEEYRFALNPHGTFSSSKEITKLTNIYVSNFWNPEEYLIRFIMTVLQFQDFCINTGIRYCSFNSFYRLKNLDIGDWTDCVIKDELSKINRFYYSYTNSSHIREERLSTFHSVWERVNPVHFYKKDQPVNSFKTFAQNKFQSDGFIGWHPSPIAHNAWADELASYIKDNGI